MSDGAAGESSQPIEAPARRPGWSYLVPGRAPALGPRQWDVLGLVVLAEISSQYATSLLNLALPQIQAGLGIPEDQLGAINAYVRVGLILTMAVTAFADHFGRRRVLLIAVAGVSGCTFATAFVTSASQFILVQSVMRVFLGGAYMLGAVVVVEEFVASDRGWGLGALAMIGALGYGLGAGLYAAIDVLPEGWRALHLVGGLPLLALPWLARRLPETERFERGDAARAAAPPRALWRALWGPVRDIAATHRGRASALFLFAFGFEVTAWTAFTFVSKHLQAVHAYSPAEVSGLFIGAGLLGILGNVVAGTLADRFGRRPVSIALLVLTGVSCHALFRASGVVVPLAWIGFIFALTGVNVVLTALAGELFPTSGRSTAAGFRMTAAAAGGMVGLSLESALYAGSHADAIVALLPSLGVAIVAVWFLPESAGRELEDISAEG